MNPVLLVTLIWLTSGVLLASYLVKLTPWKMLFGAVALTMYGGLVSIASSHDGSLFGIKQMEVSGQLLLVFFSVIGGSLVSIALSEIRQKNK